jgi:hypothetical protein
MKSLTQGRKPEADHQHSPELYIQQGEMSKLSISNVAIAGVSETDPSKISS